MDKGIDFSKLDVSVSDNHDEFSPIMIQFQINHLPKEISLRDLDKIVHEAIVEDKFLPLAEKMKVILSLEGGV